MRLGWVTPLAAARPRARDDLAGLVPALADHEIELLVDGPSMPAPGKRPVHDLGRIHYRKLFWRYDVVVYALADDPAYDFLLDALGEWPGVVMLYDDATALVRRRPALGLALERSLAIAADSEAAGAPLRGAAPFTAIETLPRDAASRARRFDALLRRARAARRRWLEPHLEAACAELPGWLPGDPRAPWHPAVAELCALGGGSPLRS